jgi:hypothetical protein
MIVEDVLTQVPDHPAGHHYVIHAYDSPDFADQALMVARNYSDVAPEVPHALHMPTLNCHEYPLGQCCRGINRW